jgi:hypothetical protein
VSIQDKALRIIAEGRIKWVQGTRYEFLVVGDSADPFHPEPYRVTEDSCTCPASRKCAHRLAAEFLLRAFRKEE